MIACEMYKLLALFLLGILAGCGGTSSSNRGAVLSFSPALAAISNGESLHLALAGQNGATIEWLVNGVLGGNAEIGSIDSAGLYIAPQSGSRTVFVTARLKTDPSVAAFGTLHVIEPGAVVGTQNPQVAQYWLDSPALGQLSVEFGPDTTYGFKTSAAPAPKGGGKVSVWVAGMRAFTQYHMRSVVEFPDGSRFVGADQVFTTGGPPAGELPSISAQNFSSKSPQPGIELINGIFGNGIPVYATDLQGNVIWWYKPPDGSGADLIYPIQPLPNGHFMILYAPLPTDALLGVAEPASTIAVIREIDLAGNTIQEVAAQEMNDLLAAAGFNLKIGIMHHEITILPNGHVIVIASEIRSLAGLDGFTAPVDVLGDDLIELDQSLHPVWVWSTFDHLDANRHPMQFPDWTHANAVVYLPQDNNLLVSIRHQNWIIKIDYQGGKGTGDILWRLGEGGDFTLAGGVDPTDWFYAQHGPALVSTEGPSVYSLSIMDNGNDRVFPGTLVCGTSSTTPCPYSTIGIYHIDEASKIASLTFQDVPHLFSAFGGNTRPMSNGDLEYDLCDIDPASFHAIIREVDPKLGGAPIWQMDLGQFAYRAFRQPSLYPGVQW
jgi:arylsulfate sulfotransferase